jgi:hypothetical protein
MRARFSDNRRQEEGCAGSLFVSAGKQARGAVPQELKHPSWEEHDYGNHK